MIQIQPTSVLNNKKTYLVVAIGLVMGVVQALDESKIISFHIPVYADVLLGFLGLGTLRNGVQAASEKTTLALVQLIETIIQGVQTVQTIHNSEVKEKDPDITLQNEANVTGPTITTTITTKETKSL